jgi:hypothetical protein
MATVYASAYRTLKKFVSHFMSVPLMSPKYRKYSLIDWLCD